MRIYLYLSIITAYGINGYLAATEYGLLVGVLILCTLNIIAYIIAKLEDDL